MLVLGPVSSLFDFLTFFALLKLFGASAAMFQTGWFIKSWPPSPSSYLSLERAGRHGGLPPAADHAHDRVVLIGLLIPLTPLGQAFGFQEPPPGFYLFLVAAVVAYLLLVELVKRLLYRHTRA